ncbi:N12 [macacine gammaherpesvirus 12]|uniref:N12 n=1 Tax=macacine gammaherpesvirus 12 TaxID=2560571 RepID=A0A0B5D5I7_9GAMA|nr:N12 [Macaca nemestrina rhadinovirus 2]AJE29727.1 N12 [Macaca nemestrina rhadinovirus 2]
MNARCVMLMSSHGNGPGTQRHVPVDLFRACTLDSVRVAMNVDPERVGTCLRLGAPILTFEDQPLQPRIGQFAVTDNTVAFANNSVARERRMPVHFSSVGVRSPGNLVLR